MKSIFTMAVTVLAVLLLSSGGLLVTHAAAPTSQTLSLNMVGGVTSAGSQHYILGQNGQALSLTVLGTSLSLTTSHLTYSLNAQQQGLTASGTVNFDLTGTLSIGGTVDISGSGKIIGTVAAVCLPDPTAVDLSGNCLPPDTSAVPAYFVGQVALKITSPFAASTTRTIPMLFESAYMNPFGAPIIIASADLSSLVIVTTYNQATIDWSNVVDSASVSGTYGIAPVGGMFTQVAQEHEDLVAGTAQDHGSFTFSGMTFDSLDSTGNYQGASTIPAGIGDCSASLGFPANSGICTITGFQSAGNFQLHTSGPNPVQMTGAYNVIWDIPAISFGLTNTATVTATVSTH